MANTVIGNNDNSAQVIGTPGNDVIIAGIGDDQVLTGNGGANVFIFLNGNQTYTISDFKLGVDKIYTDSTPLQDVTVTASPGGSAVHFDGHTIQLPNVSASELMADLNGNTVNATTAPGVSFLDNNLPPGFSGIVFEPHTTSFIMLTP
jgi:Ca2+-binding RTX toxin-like protein